MHKARKSSASRDCCSNITKCTLPVFLFCFCFLSLKDFSMISGILYCSYNYHAGNMLTYKKNIAVSKQPYIYMHISFQDNGTSIIVDCILLMSSRALISNSLILRLVLVRIVF